MAIGTSIALIAIGAILRFAVDFEITGIQIHTVGLILMIVGILGLAIGLVMMIAGNRRADPRDAPTRRF
jgi:hypothetical protein